MRICVVGAGYVGLVSAAVYADWGYEVICVDNDIQKIAGIELDELSVFEPGLPEMVKRNISDGRLTVTTDFAQAIQERDLIMIAVGTPSGENGRPDLTALWSVIKSLKELILHDQIIAIKSTVPVGTCEAVSRFLNDHASIRFDVVYTPEFLSQGTAILNFLAPDRIVIGCKSEEAKNKVMDLYKAIDCSVICTDWQSSEMIKYASNAFLAMKVSYINTIANLCEKVGANVQHVALGIGLDQRIGPAYLKPGIGFGGSCLTKDTQALLALGKDHDVDVSLLYKTLEVNQKQPIQVVRKLEQSLNRIEGKKIAVLGIAFKANTNDVREAPSLKVISMITQMGGNVCAYDPVVDLTALSRYYPFIPARTPYDAVTGADVALFLTEWDEFYALDFETIGSLMNRPIVVDGRNLFDPHEMKQKGFAYIPVGVSQILIES